ncbi:MAG: Uma2 family endonuclease [Deltaproteobacteria bacterium]|nr:Uma2 family endonuclease [Deltaproteobacteria bacterium]
MPDWTCEILSPTTRRHNLLIKKPYYARIGAPHHRIVDIEAQTITACRLESGRWLELGVWGDERDARIEPFDAIALGRRKLVDVSAGCSLDFIRCPAGRGRRGTNTRATPAGEELHLERRLGGGLTTVCAACATPTRATPAAPQVVRPQARAVFISLSTGSVSERTVQILNQPKRRKWQILASLD